MAWKTLVVVASALSVAALALADKTESYAGNKRGDRPSRTQLAPRSVNNFLVNKAERLEQEDKTVGKNPELKDNKPNKTDGGIQEKLDDVAAKEKGSFFYVGPYEGTCAYSGIYYNTAFSFVVCNHAIHYTQPCPSGTKNRNISEFKPHTFYVVSPFCSVNLNDFGYTVSKRGSLGKYNMKDKRTGGPLIPHLDKTEPHVKTKASAYHATPNTEKKAASYTNNIKVRSPKRADYKVYKVPLPVKQDPVPVKQVSVPVVEYIPIVKGYIIEQPRPAAMPHDVNRPELEGRLQHTKQQQYVEILQPIERRLPLARQQQTADISQPIERSRPSPRPKRIERPPSALRPQHIENTPPAPRSQPSRRLVSTKVQPIERSPPAPRPRPIERSQHFERPLPRRESSFEDKFHLPTDYYDHNYSGSEEISNDWRLASHEAYSREYPKRFPHRHVDRYQYHEYPRGEDIERPVRGNQMIEYRRPYEQSRETEYHPKHLADARPYDSIHHHGDYPNHSGEPFRPSEHGVKRKPVTKLASIARKPDNRDTFHSSPPIKRPSFKSKNNGYHASVSQKWQPKFKGHNQQRKGSYEEQGARRDPFNNSFMKDDKPHPYFTPEPMAWISPNEYGKWTALKGFNSREMMSSKEMRAMYPKGFFDMDSYKQGSLQGEEFGKDFWKSGSQSKDDYVYPSFKGKPFIGNPSLNSFEKNLIGKDTLPKGFVTYPYTKDPFTKEPLQGRKNKDDDNSLIRDSPPLLKSPRHLEPPPFRDSPKESRFSKEPFPARNSELHGGYDRYDFMKDESQRKAKHQYIPLAQEHWRYTSPAPVIESSVTDSSMRNNADIKSQENIAKAFSKGNKDENLIRTNSHALHERYFKSDPEVDLFPKDKVDWKDWLTDFTDIDSSDKGRDNIGIYGFGSRNDFATKRNSAFSQTKARQSEKDLTNMGSAHRLGSPEGKYGIGHRIRGKEGKEATAHEFRSPTGKDLSGNSKMATSQVKEGAKNVKREFRETDNSNHWNSEHNHDFHNNMGSFDLRDSFENNHYDSHNSDGAEFNNYDQGMKNNANYDFGYTHVIEEEGGTRNNVNVKSSQDIVNKDYDINDIDINLFDSKTNPSHTLGSGKRLKEKGNDGESSAEGIDGGQLDVFENGRERLDRDTESLYRSTKPLELIGFATTPSY